MHKARLSNQCTSSSRSGQVEFRLLCDSSSIGGLIGSNGHIIKTLTINTSSNIHVGLSTPNSTHRIVHVTGSHSLNRTISLDGRDCHVSYAQYALLRVFDRLLESEKGGGDSGGGVKCVVVAESGMVGAVMGIGGDRIHNVVKETKAYVKLLPMMSIPPTGAEVHDKLFQITGGSVPVKKALVLVSKLLQEKVIEKKRGATESTICGFMDRSMNMDTRNAQVKNTKNAAVAEVVFKLICSYYRAGSVIGYKGSKVKSIEKETRASIHFSKADDSDHERVATISAFENRESKYSVAQNATVRVFDELISSEEGNTLTTVAVRLLILPYQSDWLSSGEVSIMSTVHSDTGATLKILEPDNLPVGAAPDEKVLQIDGEYHNVQIALFQVTWTLRERFFDKPLTKDSFPLLPHKLFNLHSQRNKVSALTDKMNNCSISKETNGSLSSMPPHSQFAAGSCVTTRSTRTGNSSHSATVNGDTNFDRLCSGKKSVIVTNAKLEIAVREDKFSSVYGDNGSNLARLRMISGATVEVQDPSSGSDGKVIISGTRDQTLVAQSLLQAFLMSA